MKVRVNQAGQQGHGGSIDRVRFASSVRAIGYPDDATAANCDMKLLSGVQYLSVKITAGLDREGKHFRI